MFQFGVVGQICCDITLSGLPGMPVLGDELFADNVSICAGGIFTTSAWLKKLGADVTHISALSSDPLTTLIEAEIARHQVDLSLCKRSSRASPELTIALPVGGDRALLSHANNDGESCITAKVLANTQHLHVGGVKHLRAATVPLSAHSISLSIGAEDLLLGLDEFRRLQGIVNILFVNAREGYGLTGVANLRKALEILGAIFPVVVLTDGGRGSYAIEGTAFHHQSAMKAKVVDATGAGDSFAAGFLLDYRNTASLESALRIGAACGARAVSTIGATSIIPDRKELYQFMEASK
jgi:sugar/nucleoside kinase (ribokinase family)